VRRVDHLTPEVVDFLSAGTRTGKLAWTAADGRPLVAPIWFVVDDGAVLFNTGKETAKGRAIRRDPRLSLCVDLEEPPFATISEDPDELLRSATAIAGRYMGAERADEFGRRNGVPGELLVRLRPTKVIAEMGVAE
jgi:PPOX class probable F420-dependent enzyme